MNFYTIIILGYILVAAILIGIIIRDKKNPQFFFGRHKKCALVLTFILTIGIVLAVEARFVEPYLLMVRQISLPADKINSPLKVAFVADLQLGTHKKTAWAEKITQNLRQAEPDIVLLGGDLISNESAFEDESVYLSPLADIATRYPTFAVLGNHEYGLSKKNYNKPNSGTGDRSSLLIKRLGDLGIPTLKNDLSCLEVKNNKICIFGIDDLYGNKVTSSTFAELTDWDETTYLIFLSHNPDGILNWPQNYNRPDLVLSGHTHNGQIYLPFFGPLGDADLALGKRYYYGTKDWSGTPMIITSGAGESGGPIRLFNPPEIVIVNII